MKFILAITGFLFLSAPSFADNLIRFTAPIHVKKSVTQPPVLKIPEQADPGLQKPISAVTESYYRNARSKWLKINPSQQVLYPNTNWVNPGRKTWFFASVICAAEQGNWKYNVTADDASTVYIDGKLVIGQTHGYLDIYSYTFTMPKGCHKVITGLDNLGGAWGWFTFNFVNQNDEIISSSGLDNWTMISPASGQPLNSPPDV